MVGLAAVCLGSAARHLGRLAVTLGRRDEAGEHSRASDRRQRQRCGRPSGSPTPSSTTRARWAGARRPRRSSRLPSGGSAAEPACGRRSAPPWRAAADSGPLTAPVPDRLAAGRYPARTHVQDTRNRREAVRGARPRARAPGRVHQARGIPRGARAHRHLGGRPPGSARRSRRVRRAVQEVADGRSADRPGAASSSSSATSAPRSR